MDKRINSWLPDNFVEESVVEESYDIDEATLLQIVEEELHEYLIEEGQKMNKFKAGAKKVAGVVGRTAKRVGKHAAFNAAIQGGIRAIATQGRDSIGIGKKAAFGAKVGMVGGVIDSIIKEKQLPAAKSKLKKWEDQLKEATAPSEINKLKRQIKNIQIRIKYLRK